MKNLFNFDDIYAKNNNVALFDYTAKNSNYSIMPVQCGDSSCFDGITNTNTSENCNNYNQCFQYFNTLPYVNCVNNVPIPYFLTYDEDEADIFY